MIEPSALVLSDFKKTFKTQYLIWDIQNVISMLFVFLFQVSCNKFINFIFCIMADHIFSDQQFCSFLHLFIFEYWSNAFLFFLLYISDLIGNVTGFLWWNGILLCWNGNGFEVENLDVDWFRVCFRHSWKGRDLIFFKFRTPRWDP